MEVKFEEMAEISLIYAEQISRVRVKKNDAYYENL